MVDKVEVYASSGFIYKYVDKIKNFKFELMNEDIVFKLNRIYQKENLFIDEEGYLVLKPEEKESEIRVCNFFVIPTHYLYYNDGNKIHEAGLALEIYSKFNDEKYKRTTINLSDESIEKGNWLNTSYIDRDQLLYKTDLYKHLRVAIKLSSRILKKPEIKIYYDNRWFEDEEAWEHIKWSMSYPSLNNSDDDNESTDEEFADAVQILKAITKLTSDITLTCFSEEPSEVADNWGWEDESYLYLLYTKTYEWIKNHLIHTKYILKIKDKQLDHYLIESGVFESNEERKSGLKRADRNTSVYQGKKERVLMINKEEWKQFLLGATNSQ